MRRAMIVLTGSAVVAAARAALAFEIPLTVTEQAGVGGVRPVTIGVPLLTGQARETDALRIVTRDANGRATTLPAQFRVLARWWRADNSIRWVLCDFALPIGPKGTQTVYLTDAGADPPRPDPAVTVAEADDAITVATGPARFVIDRQRFTFIRQAFLDLNGDGRIADDEDLLANGPDQGTVVEDTYGEPYFGADGTASVAVLEAGPLRACVRARGRHLARGGRGYPPGMYGYDVFLTFYAGRSEVFADVIITNNPGTSIGAPTFEDASLLLKLRDAPTGCRLVGEKPVETTFERARSLCLYQDSNGADTWEVCQGFGHMHSNGWTYPKGRITSFRGYRVYERTQASERVTTQPAACGRVVAEGDRARGLVQVFNDRGGVVVHTLKFWQLFPKAVEVGADGTLRLGLFPRECKVPHYLEDTAAMGHEIVFHFYAGRDAPDAAQMADAWDDRLMPRPPVEHIAACGALADLGPYTVPTKGLDQHPGSGHVGDGPRLFTTDKLYGNAYGWQVYGDRWRSNGGHGRRGARQPIDEDNYLYRWYVTGRQWWYDAGYPRSRHFRDVRIYRVDPDAQDPFSFKDWQAFRQANRNEDWTNRPQPKGEAYEKYRQGWYTRSDWPFPNPEHTTLDLLYDRYCLTGDVRSLENMRIAAAHGGYFSGRGGSRLSGGWPWRANGWGWRTLERYWDLTGDPDAFACLQDVLKTHAAHIGTTPLVSYHDVKTEQVNWWFTNIYCRAVAITALHTGDPRALDLLKTLAVGKEKDARRVPTLFAVLYHLTGDTSCRDAVLGEDDGAYLLTVGGYFPACDHWLLHQPPKPVGKKAGQI